MNTALVTRVNVQSMMEQHFGSMDFTYLLKYCNNLSSKVIAPEYKEHLKHPLSKVLVNESSLSGRINNLWA